MFNKNNKNKNRQGEDFMPFSKKNNFNSKKEITKSPQLTTFQPNEYSEVDEIANHLIRNKQVRINLMNMDNKDRLRTIDFLSGIIFAFQGKAEVIGNHQYLFLI